MEDDIGVEVPVGQARATFAELIDRAMAGKPTHITRYGKRVATISPAKPAPGSPQRDADRRLAAQLHELACLLEDERPEHRRVELLLALHLVRMELLRRRQQSQDGHADGTFEEDRKLERDWALVDALTIDLVVDSAATSMPARDEDLQRPGRLARRETAPQATGSGTSQAIGALVEQAVARGDRVVIVESKRNEQAPPGEHDAARPDFDMTRRDVSAPAEHDTATRDR